MGSSMIIWYPSTKFHIIFLVDERKGNFILSKNLKQVKTINIDTPLQLNWMLSFLMNVVNIVILFLCSGTHDIYYTSDCPGT